MKLYVENKRDTNRNSNYPRLNEKYDAYYICDAKYSDPAKQQLAEWFNDRIQDTLENCYMVIPSAGIEGLPEPPDYIDSSSASAAKTNAAIKNLVMALVEEYYGE